MDFETIHRRHKNIKRKIARCKESSDLKRLLGLRDQLERVRQNIHEMKPMSETAQERTRLVIFRRSYSYESFMDSLSLGKKFRHAD